MAQYYSDPSREKEPYALPDLEVFWAEENELGENDPGYYYWFCFPGCCPDSEAVGPYRTEEEALADVRSHFES